MSNCNVDLQSVITGLSKLKKKALKKQTEMLKPFGLTSRHAGYIMALSDGRGMTMKALSETLCVDPANTTRVIAYLDEMGYVANDCQKDGCRKFNVFLTDKGKEIAAQMKKSVECNSVEIMDPLTEDEKRTFVYLLFKMAMDNDDEE